MLIESSRNLRVVGQKTLIKGGLKNKSLCAVNVAINKHIVTIYTALTHFSCYVLSGTCIRRLSSGCQEVFVEGLHFPFLFSWNTLTYILYLTIPCACGPYNPNRNHFLLPGYKDAKFTPPCQEGIRLGVSVASDGAI